MAEFLIPDSYARFARHAKTEIRYLYDSENRSFLATVLATCQSRRFRLEKDTILWRGQRAYEIRTLSKKDGGVDVPCAASPKRMIPKADVVGEGRVNPRGIPCLYLSTNIRTALAEVRPWVGSLVSVAEFKVKHRLVLVDCTKDIKKWHFPFIDPELTADEMEKTVWGDICDAYARPVTPDDPVTEYIPTQILAENFKVHGFHGIIYRSNLGDENNVALFHTADADLLNCGLYEAQTVTHSFRQADNPYFIKKHYPKTFRIKARKKTNTKS